MGQQDGTAPEPRFEVVADRRPAAAAVKFYRIRDFERFQHYRDRALVWIKLYVDQLDAYEFLQLPDAMKYHVHALMLLAARAGNKIPNDARWVAARIGATEPVDLPTLFAAGFLEEWRPRPQDSYAQGEQLPLPTGDAALPATSNPASNSLAGRPQNAASNLLAQNRAEQSRGHTDTDTSPASAGRVCGCCGVSVCSEFSRQEAEALVKRWKSEGRLVGGRPINNVFGLARVLHREGTADDELRMLKHPPPRREFTDDPCPSCFGTKTQSVEGKGARPCPDCIDETGRRTGKRPKDAGA